MSELKNKITEELHTEKENQYKKWGKQNHTPIEWLAILMEEVGEVSKEALEHHFQKKNFSIIDKSWNSEKLSNYRKELLQVGAVIISMIECLDENGA